MFSDMFSDTISTGTALGIAIASSALAACATAAITMLVVRDRLHAARRLHAFTAEAERRTQLAISDTFARIGIGPAVNEATVVAPIVGSDTTTTLARVLRSAPQRLSAVASKAVDRFRPLPQAAEWGEGELTKIMQAESEPAPQEPASPQIQVPLPPRRRPTSKVPARSRFALSTPPPRVLIAGAPVFEALTAIPLPPLPRPSHVGMPTGSQIRARLTPRRPTPMAVAQLPPDPTRRWRVKVIDRDLVMA